VRAALLQFQRDFAARPPGAVLDGRDIGTVVCPEAQLKLFVTASLEARAERRRAELAGRGEPVSADAIQADLRARDERDSARGTAPLRAADDAFRLDTTAMTIDEVLAAAASLVEARRPGGSV
jgi:cytidylate kinase